MSLVYPKDRPDAMALARQLLEAAGREGHDEVRTTSDGPLGVAFDVPDDLAQRVLGISDGRVLETSSEPAAAASAVSTSARAGADTSEADANADGGSSQPPARASRSSRTSRSGR